MNETGPPVVVVMGVSGTGKTTIGTALADRLGLEYADADDFHPPANKQKMAAGLPLDDADRRPWLDAIGGWLAAHSGGGGVISCSALKRAYRDRLRRHCPRADFVHLHGSAELIAERITGRKGHFMPGSLLDSQLRALEPLAADERGVVLDVAQPVEVVVDQAVAHLGGST